MSYHPSPICSLKKESNFRIQIPSPMSYLPSSNLLTERGKQFPNPHSLTYELPPFSNPFIERGKQFQNPNSLTNELLDYIPSSNMFIKRRKQF
jgi:hypothetical protein